MSWKQSIAEVLVDLEAQIAELEKLDAFHAEREEFHRGQRADFAGKLAKIRTKYEAFQAAASEVAMPMAGAPSRIETQRFLKLAPATGGGAIAGTVYVHTS